MFKVEDSVLVLIDVQEKLFAHTADNELLQEGIRKLVSGLKILGVPIIWVEQNPEKMGGTVKDIADLLVDEKPISKSAFSCYREESFLEELKGLSRKQVVVCGIESHVCVYQTVSDLLDGGYEVEVVEEGVSSRTLESKRISLQKMRDIGAKVTSVEMLLFELMLDFKHEKFREISRLIK